MDTQKSRMLQKIVEIKYSHISLNEKLEIEPLNPVTCLVPHEVKKIQAYIDYIALLSAEERIDLWECETLKAKFAVTSAIAPEDKSRFFNETIAIADFKLWAKKPYWKLEEIPALLLSRDPTVVTKIKMQPYLNKSAFAKQYFNIEDDVSRAAKIGALKKDPLPVNVIEWAENLDYEVPKELKTLAFSQHNNNQKLIFKSQQENNNKTAVTKEQESLLKMCAAMAIDGYGYNPAEKRSNFPKELCEILNNHNAPLSTDTIRKFLKKGIDLLEPVMQED